MNAGEKLFYCFGCQKGGDLIGFVRETEGLDFVGAVEWLADRVGIRSSTRSRPGRGRGAPSPRAPARTPRVGRTVLRAAPVGDRERRARAGLPHGAWTRGGRVPRSGWAFPRGAPRSRPRPANAGSHRPSGCGGHIERPRQRPLRVASRLPARRRTGARARVRRPPPARGRSDPGRRYLNSPEMTLRKATTCTGSMQRARPWRRTTGP